MENADTYKPDAQASGFGASYSLACVSDLYGRKPGVVQLEPTSFKQPPSRAGLMSHFKWIVVVSFIVTSIAGISPADRIRQGPQALRGGEHGVGTVLPAVGYQDLTGNSFDLSEVAKQHRAVVIAMTSTTCPLSLKYLPTLIELANQYSEQGVHFVVVNSVSADKVADMETAQQRLGGHVTYVFDKSGEFAQAVGAETTTDVIAIDSARTIFYHGAIDDQYGFGYSRASPRNQYLADAIQAQLSGDAPNVEATDAPGCRLRVKKLAKGVGEVTYHGRVSRLMNRHCVQCHREGGVGPFRLDTYDDVVSHAPMIREVVHRGIMPPWFADTDDHSKVSPWSNDASLTPAEKQDLLAWIEGDQSQGDTADAPQPLKFDGRWQIGTPDAVFEFPRAFSIRATGVMPYKHITVDTDLDEDKWVQEIEILPGEPSVVHHVLVYVIAPGMRTENPIDYWAVYVPGNGSHTYPEGYARRLPKGAKLRFQMHYTPNGTATKDKTKIGLKFADQPPTHEVHTASIVNGRFAIPPRAKHHKVEAELKMPVDVQILGYLPHHHLRGVAARYELISQDGDKQMLLDVPGYDFNWQLFYEYAKPPVFSKGTTVRYTGWYDNSEDNPANPDPDRTVRWGAQTDDEMHVGYVEYAEPLDANWNGKYKGLRGELLKSFVELDANSDGELSVEEAVKLIPEWAPVRLSTGQMQRFFKFLDTDQSGGLNDKEFDRVRQQFKRMQR